HHPEAVGLEHAASQPAEPRVVIDDEDRPSHGPMVARTRAGECTANRTIASLEFHPETSERPALTAMARSAGRSVRRGVPSPHGRPPRRGPGADRGDGLLGAALLRPLP